MAEETDEDPRASLDDLIGATNRDQWFKVLDEQGGPDAEGRKWDIAEWLLLEHPDARSIERLSGLNLSAIDEVSSSDFRSIFELTGQAKSKVDGDTAGLFAAIERRHSQDSRTNTSDLFNPGVHDRVAAFKIVARAQRSGLVKQSPPDFQWHITAAGHEWRDLPRPSDDLFEEEGAD